jgi:hypothetical protein
MKVLWSFSLFHRLVAPMVGKSRPTKWVLPKQIQRVNFHSHPKEFSCSFDTYLMGHDQVISILISKLFGRKKWAL